MSTWEYNIYTIDYLHGNLITNIKYNKNNTSSIAGDFFWDIMQERDGTLWLGTVGGISICHPDHTFYKIHDFSDSLFRPANYAIQTIAENINDTTWWFTTNNNLLVQYNPKNDKTVNYSLRNMLPNKKGLLSTFVNRVLFINNSVLLFSSSGAWIKEKNGNVFRPFILPTLSDTTILVDGVSVGDKLIYCTDGKKLWRYDLQAEKVKQIMFSSKIPYKSDKETGIYFLTLSPNNNTLWTINAAGWISYVQGDQLIPYKFSTLEIDQENEDYRSMTADDNGRIWIANKGAGLLNYCPKDHTCLQYKQYDGLAMDHIMTVAADKKGSIWTAAYNKFSIFNPNLKSFYNFDLPLSDNNYGYVNRSLVLKNGHIIVSIADKIVEFFPHRLTSYAISSAPLISAISVLGQERMIFDDNDITLSSNENNIILKFGVLIDKEVSAFDIMYISEGAEKNWTIASTNGEASYNSLPSGAYTFKVKAIAKDKSRQTNESILNIHIATPFYKTWWFILIVIALVLFLLYKVYQYRLHQHQSLLILESRTQLLEKEKTAVMYENLKQQLNPHFLFNSLTSLSGLIQIDQNIASTFLNQMSGIYRYILKNGNSETVSLRDEIEFVHTYVSLQQTRFSTGLIVNIDINEEYMHHKIAPVTLQNLIENALKHNIIDEDSPLEINIFIEDPYIVVCNNLQKKNVVETSNKKGLIQFLALYKYLSPLKITIEESASFYTIKIPLI